MKKQYIKALARQSFKNNQLQETLIFDIAKRLNRKYLKKYIKELIMILKQKNVIIALPNINVYNKGEKIFEKFFEKELITYLEDPSLILGVKIQRNDMIYDLSLKNTLDEIGKSVTSMYE